MKFLFIASDFAMGGITSSLKNLTDKLIKEKHDVAILNLAMENKPVFINDKVRFIELYGRARKCHFSISLVKKAKWFKKPFLYFLGLIKKIIVKKGLWDKYVFKKFYVEEYFDYAIAFRQEPMSIYLAKNNVNCKLKVSFWHCDPDAEDTSSWDSCVNGLDYVVGVSDRVSNCFLEKHKDIKTKTVYNIFDYNDIVDKSKTNEKIYHDTFNIVTVSRIDFAFKNIDRIPVIAQKLKQDGFKFCWTIVGGGADKEKLIEIIKDNDCEDCVKLVGAKDNPYTYIKQANLFALTSSWESYGMVVMESLILNTPVVAGFYPALPEIIEDRKTGLIAENSSQGIYVAIKELLENKQLYNSLKDNCNKYQYDDSIAYNQFISLGEDDNEN